MNEIQAEIVDDTEQFFAPAPSDLINRLLGQYDSMRSKVERVGEVMNGSDLAGALNYFAEYAATKDRHLSSSTVETMFDVKGAIAHLNSAYWSKAMQLTDVLDVMPQARRDAWHRQMRNPLGQNKKNYSNESEIEPIPEFNEENVRSTLMSLLAQREKFFAERVDGIFFNLSKEHVTNCPEAFSKRMIIGGAIDNCNIVDNSKAGVINDLRCIIAKFMGRAEPKYDATRGLIIFARSRRGEWIDVDGGALRIRCYMVGTAHLDVHPDMAWRLNCVLAQLHPLAIPSKFREKPQKKAKEYKMIGRPLPFSVLYALSSLKQAYDYTNNSSIRTKAVPLKGLYSLKVDNDEASKVLIALGGVKDGQRWAFDYNPLEIMQEIVASGCIPDQKSHQFYPTPEKLARIACELAEINEYHACLEPSAGVGGLADMMPKTTFCYEISALHCKVLRAKGYTVREGDFLSATGKHDRIVMNPPFSEGRWQAHTMHASSMLAPNGRLVAILPASAKNSGILSHMNPKFHGPYDNEFAGTSVSVVIVVIEL